MDDRYIEKMLEEYKENLPVNNELKKELRSEYIKQKRKMSGFKRFSIASGIMAAVFILVFVFQRGLESFIPDNKLMQEVNAETLKVNDYASIMEIDVQQSTDISEYKGTLYIPLFGSGLYKYDNSGLQEIYSGQVNSVRVSRDGKKLLLSLLDGAGILDIKTNEMKYILKAENENTYIENLSFGDNTDTIIYTRKVIASLEPHGYEVKESNIYIYDLKTGKKDLVAKGEYASIIKGGEAILFEREGKIIYKNLKDNTEIQIDEGSCPSASPDGKIVTYGKTEKSVKKVNEMISIEEYLSNIYIADISTVPVKKKLTTNYPNYFISEEEWIKSTGTPKIPNVLTYYGMYDYASPVWSSDSKSIYAIKHADGASKIIKIDFSTEKNKAEDTVKSYIQALISRNDDFARGLLSYKMDTPLTISNPHQSGYKILSSGKEVAKNYVEAEIYFSYYGQAYYRAERKRFYLSENDNGYLIDKISDIYSTNVYEKNGTIYMDGRDYAGKTILKAEDLGIKLGLNGSFKFTSVAYSSESNRIYFSAEGDEKLIICECDSQDHTVRLKYDFKEKRDISKPAVSQINVSSSGKYISVDFYSSQGTDAGVIVLDTTNNKALEIKSLLQNTNVEGINTLCWNGDILIYKVSAGGESSQFKYSPKE